GRGAAAGGGRGGRGGGGAGAGGFAGPAQLQIVVTGPDGQTFATVNGSANEGINRTSWNMRGEAPPAAAPSLFEEREQAAMKERALSVQDSLLAAGWEEDALTPIIQRFTGEATGFPGGFGGGRGGGFGGNAEVFRDRPGETPPGSRGGGGNNFGQMRQVAEIIAPGGGIQSLFRRFAGGGGGGAPLAEPGTYSLTMTVGSATFTQQLVVDRVGNMSGNNSPFENERNEDADLEWLFGWMARR
ncbi:MAG: hypothetical protein O2992_16375, partial [Gemmatimonadetes bacterium]|nr:hypothetical protein [Gemmatimonadota bacterium]